MNQRNDEANECMDWRNLVEPSEACPCCGNRVMDCLVWSWDGDHVECQACGAWYDPAEV